MTNDDLWPGLSHVSPTLRRIASGSALFRKGDPTFAIFRLASGKIRLARVTACGAESCSVQTASLYLGEPSLWLVKNIIQSQIKIGTSAFYSTRTPLKATMMITMNVLNRTNLQDDYMHSLLISLLRGLAALEVAAAHLRAQIYPGYGLVEHPTVWFQGFAFITGFAHQAVILFFLLSGWLVGGSLLNKSGTEDAIKHYFIDRISRLWIVLIPTFLLILMFGMLAGKVDAQVAGVAPDNDYSATAFLGNLFGLQNMAVPAFGGNFPLWSLSNETWYYVMFPLLVAGTTARSTWMRSAAIGGLAALCWSLSGTILLYFAIWLMGAGCSRIKIDASPVMRWLFFSAFAIVAVYFRMRGWTNGIGPETFLQDYIFSVAFLLFLAGMQYRVPANSPRLLKVKRFAKFFADFSFTLYVVHVPLIGIIVFLSPYLSANLLSANDPLHLAIYVALYAVIVAASYLFHLPFEANTHRLRRYLKNVAFSGGAIRT